MADADPGSQSAATTPGDSPAGSRRRRVRGGSRRRTPSPATGPSDTGTGTADQGPGPSGDGPGAPDAAPPEETEGGVELLVLRDGLTPVVDTAEALAETVEAVRRGTGPVGIDAERASGYRYSQRAYLVQLRREGSGTHLVDPIPLGDLDALDEAIGDTEWILHAATQDLACLAEIGLHPRALFDTELAGRLLGFPRVALATLVEELLGRRLRKEHSAVDWSTRPLPEPWLEYAALDVEVLVELRDTLEQRLEADGKREWARQEFAHLLSFVPAVREEPWRRVSGLHKVRGRRGLAAVRALWLARDELAEQRDVTPGRILPDKALVAGATTNPTTKAELLAAPGFRGRGAERYSRRWLAALDEARALSDADLPTIGAKSDGPPPPRAWADRDPVAARRLTAVRDGVKELAEAHSLPPENLLAPDHLRRAMWQPPETREPDALRAELDAQLTTLGSRPWQRDLVLDLLVTSVIDADTPPPEPGPGVEPETIPEPGTDAPAADG